MRTIYEAHKPVVILPAVREECAESRAHRRGDS